MDLLGTDQQRGKATGEDDRGQLLKHGNRNRETEEREREDK